MDSNECADCSCQFQYIPFICEDCGCFLCLNCVENENYSVCQNCKAVQMVSLELAKPKKKCVYANCCNEATFINKCASLENTHIIDSLNCLEISVCNEHVTRCKVCDKMLCHVCAEFKHCKTHLKYCCVGRHYDIPSKIYHCITCDKSQCLTCFDKKRSTDILLNYDRFICGIHIRACNCGKLLYDAPMFRCSTPFCTQIACLSGWFVSSDTLKLNACHKHIFKCYNCKNDHSNIEQNYAKFLEGDCFALCKKCFVNYQNNVLFVLLIFKKQTNIKLMSKNILNLIFRQLFENYFQK